MVSPAAVLPGSVKVAPAEVAFGVSVLVFALVHLSGDPVRLERLEHAAARAVIVPDTIVIDHGSVFISAGFRSACRHLGISVQPAHLGSGAEITSTPLGVSTARICAIPAAFVR